MVISGHQWSSLVIIGHQWRVKYLEHEGLLELSRCDLDAPLDFGRDIARDIAHARLHARREAMGACKEGGHARRG